MKPELIRAYIYRNEHGVKYVKIHDVNNRQVLTGRFEELSFEEVGEMDNELSK